MGTTNPATGAEIVEMSSAGAAAMGAGATGANVPASAEMTGARAATANPANATDGKLVAAMADKAGRLVVTPGQIRDLVGIQTTTISASTAETTIITAGAAGVFNDLSCLIISTTDSAAAGTVTIKDATGGTTRMVIDYPNAAAVPTGAPLVIPFPIPVPQAVAANNWTATVSPNAAAIKITAVFVKNT